jgi:hypothetical protein
MHDPTSSTSMKPLSALKWLCVISIATTAAGVACSSSSDGSSPSGTDSGTGKDAGGGQDATTADATVSQDDSGGGGNDGGGSGNDAATDAGPQATMVVSPATATVAIGYSQPYQAKLVFADGGSLDITAAVTWSTSDAGGATVSNDGGVGIAENGLATGVSQGTVSVVATDPKSSLSASGMLTIDGTTCNDLFVMPNPATVDAGATLQMHANCMFSDATNRDVTRSCVWIVGNTNIATCDNKGVVTGKMAGGTSIEAQPPPGAIPDTGNLNVQ